MGELARLLVRAAPHLWARYKGRIVAGGAGAALLVAGLVTYESASPPSCYTIVPQKVADRPLDWSVAFYGSDLDDLQATQQTMEERGFELTFYRSGTLEETHYLHMHKRQTMPADEAAFRSYQEDLCDVARRHDLAGTTGIYDAYDAISMPEEVGKPVQISRRGLDKPSPRSGR